MDPTPNCNKRPKNENLRIIVFYPLSFLDSNSSAQISILRHQHTCWECVTWTVVWTNDWLEGTSRCGEETEGEGGGEVCSVKWMSFIMVHGSQMSVRSLFRFKQIALICGDTWWIPPRHCTVWCDYTRSLWHSSTCQWLINCIDMGLNGWYWKHLSSQSYLCGGIKLWKTIFDIGLSLLGKVNNCNSLRQRPESHVNHSILYLPLPQVHRQGMVLIDSAFGQSSRATEEMQAGIMS